MGLRKAITRGEENVINKGYQTPPKSKNKHAKHHQGRKEKGHKDATAWTTKPALKKANTYQTRGNREPYSQLLEDPHRAREGTAEYTEWNKQI